MKFLGLLFSFLISLYVTAQTSYYVNPDVTQSPSADGSLANPYNDIAATVELLQATGGEVIIIDGEYDMTGKKVTITTAATASTVITIKPQSNAGVTLIFKERFGFHFEETSRHIILEGLELDGRTDELDYWCIVAQAFWGDESIPRNGGLAIILDGQYITIRDNYIHDFYQKAVEIHDARYVVIEGNIIHDIATTSLSGGHGIMRQQKGQEFFDDDVPGVYRWDIRENMLFKVEQRIYSWVPKKGFIEMVIDEGKSILIDDPKDTDGIQEEMTARIINNVVAFGSVDAIRLKSTPNLEVSHNSVYGEGPKADGITDKQGDTNTPQFTNFIFHYNASQTITGISALEIDKAVEQTENAGGTPDVVENYAMDGKIKPNNQGGLNRLTNGQLFVNPQVGNFRINPALSLPSALGVSTGVLDDLDLKVADYSVPVGPGTFQIDHLKLTQTILDNIPGVNDGIPNNETVFEDHGTMSGNYHTITYDVVPGDWQDNTNSPNQQEFHLNEVYYTWYENIDINYQNGAGDNYERIRWGDSEVKQDQEFDPDWLTVSQITSNSNTLINGYDNTFVLDGDLLVDFEGFTPVVGDMFDLITAGAISSNNSGDLFDLVHFEGFTPDNYTLEVVQVGSSQVVRLTITELLPIEFLSFNVRKENRFAHLNWVTLSEDGSDFFSIERRAQDGHWQEIGRVSGHGYSTAMSHYDFIDKTPSVGHNYYRLRQYDFDGDYSYSQVEVVSFHEHIIEIYPNPSNDWFVLYTDTQISKIQLFDGIGREVSDKCSITPVNDGYLFLNKMLVPGIYFLIVDKESVKVVVN